MSEQPCLKPCVAITKSAISIQGKEQLCHSLTLTSFSLPCSLELRFQLAERKWKVDWRHRAEHRAEQWAGQIAGYRAEQRAGHRAGHRAEYRAGHRAGHRAEHRAEHRAWHRGEHRAEHPGLLCNLGRSNLSLLILFIFEWTVFFFMLHNKLHGFNKVASAKLATMGHGTSNPASASSWILTMTLHWRPWGNCL